MDKMSLHSNTTQKKTVRSVTIICFILTRSLSFFVVKRQNDQIYKYITKWIHMFRHPNTAYVCVCICVDRNVEMIWIQVISCFYFRIFDHAPNYLDAIRMVIVCDPGPIYNRIQSFMKIYEHCHEYSAKAICLFVKQKRQRNACTRKQIAQTLHNKFMTPPTSNVPAKERKQIPNCICAQLKCSGRNVHLLNIKWE